MYFEFVFWQTWPWGLSHVKQSMHDRTPVIWNPETSTKSPPYQFISWIPNNINLWKRKQTLWLSVTKTLQKAQRTRGLSSSFQSNLLGYSQVQTQILIKLHLQNLDPAFTSKSELNITSSTKLGIRNTKPSFSISTNIQLHNLCKTSATKYWPNASLKILPELQHQNLDQTLCSNSEQKFGFITKPQLPSMQQIVANTIFIINISKSANLNKFWVGIFTCQAHIDQVY